MKARFEARGYTERFPIQNFLSAFSRERGPFGDGVGTTGLGGQYVTESFIVGRLSVGSQAVLEHW